MKLDYADFIGLSIAQWVLNRSADIFFGAAITAFLAVEVGRIVGRSELFCFEN